MGRPLCFRMTFGGTVLALMLVASSCSGEQGNSNGEEVGPAPEEVTREVTKVVTVAEAPPAAPRENADAQTAPPPAPAPSEPPPPPAAPALPGQESPEGVLALQYSRLNAGDYEGAYALFDEASKQATSADQYRAYFESLAPYSITDYSFPSVDVQGDTATVEAALTTDSAEGGESYQVTQELVRDGGEWRPVMRDEQLASFAPAGQENAQYDSRASSEPEPTSEPADEEVGEVFVRVTGDPGINFSGNIGTLDGSRSVEGTTPEEFAVEVDTGAFAFDSVSALAQNSDGSGTLVVQIVRDGEVVKEQSTTAQYGVADVTWSPSE